MATAQSLTWVVDLFIGNSPVNWGGENTSTGSTGLSAVRDFEYCSFINGGFSIRAKIESVGFLLDPEFNREYFFYGRQLDRPTFIRFRLGWASGLKSQFMTAVLTDVNVDSSGGQTGTFEFIGVDPLTFYINQGSGSGKVYRGKLGTNLVGGQRIKGVIEQVLDDYIPNRTNIIGPIGRSDLGDMNTFSIKKIVDPTDDAPSKYYMMRQDPKTFITSLLDWSSPFTKDQTYWVVTSGEYMGTDNVPTIAVTIRQGYAPQLVDDQSSQEKQLILSFGGNSGLDDVSRFKYTSIPVSSSYHNRLVTSGISAISGQYIDGTTGENDDDAAFIDDSNTGNKTNPTIDHGRGFYKARSKSKGMTYVKSIPEFNAGDIGYKYSRYINGKARQLYFNLQHCVSRVKARARGQPLLTDPFALGRSFITMRFDKAEDGSVGTDDATPFNGSWLLYGWHHKMSRTTGDWTTDVYVDRCCGNSWTV